MLSLYKKQSALIDAGHYNISESEEDEEREEEEEEEEGLNAFWREEKEYLAKKVYEILFNKVMNE